MPALSTLLHAEPAIRRALRLAALVLLTAIVIAGSVPGARAEVGQFASGVVLHSLAYAGLTALWFLGSHGTPLQRALAAMLAIALMGALDEGVQSFLPYRSGDIRDWLVDITAATCASSALAVATSLIPARAASVRLR